MSNRRHLRLFVLLLGWWIVGALSTAPRATEQCEVCEVGVGDDGITEQLLNDMNAVGAFDATLEGAARGADVFAAYGYGPYVGDIKDAVIGPDGMSCARKTQLISQLEGLEASLNRQYWWLQGCSFFSWQGAAMCGPSLAVVISSLNAAAAAKANLQGKPCIPNW